MFTTSVTMVRRMRMTAPRRNRLNAHGNKLQAAKKVALELLALCKETVILVLGDGTFSPSTKGHASAPNKRLPRLLSKYIPIVTSSEYKTSQMSPCCGVRLRELPSPGRKRVVSKVCPLCQKQWNRDVAAALYIGHIFVHQCQTCDHSLPTQFQ